MLEAHEAGSSHLVLNSGSVTSCQCSLGDKLLLSQRGMPSSGHWATSPGMSMEELNWPLSMAHTKVSINGDNYYLA